MFKKLREKITEEVQQTSLKLPVSVQQQLSQLSSFGGSGGDLSERSRSPENNMHDELLVDISEIKPAGDNKDLFSIDEDSREGTPSKASEFQVVELADSNQPSASSSPQKEVFSQLGNHHPFDPSSPCIMSPSVVPLRRRRSSDGSCVSEISGLFPIYEVPGVSFSMPQSDLESCSSEWEESNTVLDRLSKDTVYQAYLRMRLRYHKYKGRYSDIAKAFQEKEKETEKLRDVLAKQQDKAVRRVSELREQCSLEQQAKAHLEQELRSDIEERDHKIEALQTKVRLLQEGFLTDGSFRPAFSTVQQETEKPDESEEEPQSIPSLHHADELHQGGSRVEDSDNVSVGSLGSISTAPTSLESDELIERLKGDLAKHKTLLTRCMDNIKANKERITMLRQEKDNALSQLKELTGYVEALKVDHEKELDSLRASVESSALSMAETKQQFFEELQTKEAEVEHYRKRTEEQSAVIKNQLEQIEELKNQSEEELEIDLEKQHEAEEEENFKDLQSKCTELEKLVADLQKSKKDLELQTEDDEKILKDLKGKVEEMEKVNGELECKKTELEARLMTLASQKDEISLQLNISLEEVRELKIMKDASLEEVKELKIMKDASLEEVKELKIMKDALNEKLKNALEAKNQINLEKVKISQDLSKLFNENDSLKEEIGQLTSQTEENSSVVNCLRQILEQENKTKEALEAENKVAYDKLRRGNVMIEELRRKLEEEEESCPEIPSESSTFRQEQRFQEPESYHQETESAFKKICDKLSNLRVSNNELKVSNNKLQVTNSELLVTNNELLVTNNDLQVTNNKLRNKLRNIENTVQVENDKFQDLNKEYIAVIKDKDDANEKLTELRNTLISHLVLPTSFSFEDVQNKLNKLQTDNEQLQSKIKELSDTCSRVEEIMAKKDSMVHSQQSQLTDYEKQLFDLESKLREYECKILEFKECEAKRSNSESKLKEYEVKISELNECKTRLSDFESKLREYETKISEYVSELNASEATVTAFESREKEYEVMISQYVTQIKESEMRFTDSEFKKREYGAKISEYVSKLKESKARFAEAEAKITNVESSLSETMLSLENKEKSWSIEMENKTEKLKNLMEERNEQLADVEEKLQTRETELDALKEKLKDSQDSMERLRHICKDRERDLESLRQESDEKLADMETFRQQVEYLEQSLKLSRNEGETQRKELQSVNCQLEKGLQDCQKKICDCEKQLQEKESLVENLMSELQMTREKHEALVSELTRNMENAKNLSVEIISKNESEMKLVSNQLKKSETDIENLNNQYKILQMEKATLEKDIQVKNDIFEDKIQELENLACDFKTVQAEKQQLADVITDLKVTLTERDRVLAEIAASEKMLKESLAKFEKKILSMIEEKKQILKDFEEQATQFERNLSEKEIEIQKICAEYARRLDETVAEHEEKLTEVKILLQKLTAEKELMQGRIIQFDALQMQKDATEKQLEESERMRSQMQESHVKRCRDVEEEWQAKMRRELEKLQSEHDRKWADSLVAREGERDDQLSAAEASFKRSLDRKDSEIANLGDVCNSLRAEMEEYQAAREEELRSVREELERKNSNLEEQVKVLREKLAATEQQMEEQDMEEECQRLQNNLRELMDDRSRLHEEFEHLLELQKRLMVQLHEDTLSGEGHLLTFQTEKKRVEDRLEQLEMQLRDKNKKLLELDAKASEYLLKVTTASNTVYDEDDPSEQNELQKNLIQKLVKEELTEHSEHSGKSGSHRCDSESGTEDISIKNVPSLNNDDSLAVEGDVSSESGSDVLSDGKQEEAAGRLSPSTKEQIISLSNLVSELKIVKDEMGRCITTKDDTVAALEEQLHETRRELASLKDSMSEVSFDMRQREEGFFPPDRDSDVRRLELEREVRDLQDVTGQSSLPHEEKLELLQRIEILESMIDEDSSDIEVEDLTTFNLLGGAGGSLRASRDFSSGLLRARTPSIRSASVLGGGSVSERVALLERELAEANEKLRQAHGHMQSLTKEKDRKIKECERLRSKVNNVERKMNDLQGTFDSLVKTVMGERDLLVKDMEDKERLVEELKKDIETKPLDLGLYISRDELTSQLGLVEKKYSDELNICKSALTTLDEKHVAEIQNLKQRMEGKEREFKIANERELETLKNDFCIKEHEFLLKIERLENEKVTLGHKNEEIENERGNLVSNKEHYEGIIKQLENKKEQYESKIGQLEDEKQQFESTIGHLEDKKQQFESKIEQLAYERVNFESKIDQLENEKANFESKIRKLKDEKEQFESKIEQIKKEKGQFESETEQFEERRHDNIKEKLESDKEQLREMKEQLDKEREQIEREKDMLLKEKEQIEREKEKVEKEKEQCESDKEQFVREKEQFENEKETLANEKGLESEAPATVAEDTATDIRDELRELQEKYERLKDRMFKLQQEHQTHLSASSTLKVQLKAKEKETAELKDKVSALESAVSAGGGLSSKVEETSFDQCGSDRLSEDRSALEMTFSALQEEHRESLKISEDLAARIEQLESEREDMNALKQQLEDLNAKNLNLTSEMYSKEEEMTEELNAREATIQALRVTLTNNQKQSKENYQMLQDDIAALNMRYAREKEELQALITHLKEKCVKLEEDGQQAQHELDAMRNSMESLQQATITSVEVVSPSGYGTEYVEAGTVESVASASAVDHHEAVVEEEVDSSKFAAQLCKAQEEYDKVIAEREDTIMDLSCKVEDLEKQLSDCSSRSKVTEEESFDLRNRFEIQMKQIAELNEFISDLQGKMGEMSGESSALKKTVDQLKAEKVLLDNDKKSLIKDFEAKLSEMRSTQEALETKLAEAKRSRQSLETDLEAKKNLVEGLNFKLNDIEANVLEGPCDVQISLIDRLDMLGSFYDKRIRENNDKFLAKINTMEKEVETLKREMDAVQVKAAQSEHNVTKRMTDLENENSRLKDEKKSLMRSYEKEQKLAVEMQNQMVSDLERLILNLESEKKDLEAELKALREQLDSTKKEYGNKINLLQESLSLLERERDVLRMEIARLTGNEPPRTDTNDDDEYQINSNECLSLIEDLTSKVTRLRTKLEEAQASLEQKGSNLKECLTRERSLHQAEMKRLRKDMREELDILEQEKEDIRREMESEIERVAAEWARRLESCEREKEMQLMDEKAQFGRVLVGKNDEYEKLSEEKLIEATTVTATDHLKSQLDDSLALSAELQEQLEDASCSVTSLSTKLETVTESQQHLTNQTNEVEADRVVNMEFSNNDLRQKIDALQTELTTLEQQMKGDALSLENRLKKEREASEDDYNGRVSSLTDKLNSLMELESVQLRQIGDLEKRNIELDSKLKELQQERDFLKSENDRRICEWQNLGHELTLLLRGSVQEDSCGRTMNEDSTGVYSKLRSLDQAKNEAIKELLALRVNYATLSQETNQHKYNIDRLLPTITTLEQNISSLESSNVSLRTELQAVKDSNKILETSLSSLQTQLSEEKIKSSNYEKDINEFIAFKTTHQTLSEETSQKQRMINDLLSKNSTLEKRIGVLELSETSLINDLKTLKEVKNNLESLSVSLNTQLSDKDKKLSEFARIMNEIDQTVSSIPHISPSNAKDIKSLLIFLTNENENLKKQLLEEIATSGEISNELKDAKNLINLMQKEANETERENTALSSKLRQTELQLSSLQEANEARIASAKVTETQTDCELITEQNVEMAVGLCREELYNEFQSNLNDTKTKFEEKERELERKWRAKSIEMVREREREMQGSISQLTTQWKKEKEELERLTEVAAAAFKSGTDSVDLLKKQVAAQKRELELVKQNYRKEVGELQTLLEVKRRVGRGGHGEVKLGVSLEDSAEFEYLKNILYQYMLGKETQTLAKVLCAVVNFSKEQQRQIIELEEKKLSLLRKEEEEMASCQADIGK